MDIFTQVSNASRPQSPMLTDFTSKQLEAMQKSLHHFIIHDPQFSDFKDEVAELEIQILTAKVIVKHRETAIQN